MFDFLFEFNLTEAFVKPFKPISLYTLYEPSNIILSQNDCAHKDMFLFSFKLGKMSDEPCFS